MTPKVRGVVRSESRIPVYRNGKDQPPTMKQLVSQVDREANDNISMTASALAGDVIVSAVLDHEGGVVVVITQKGKTVLSISMPELGSERPTQIATGDIAARLSAIPR
jgi:hypothetical protein